MIPLITQTMFQVRDKLKKKKNSELKSEQSKQDSFVSIPLFKFSVILSMLIKLCYLIPFSK